MTIHVGNCLDILPTLPADHFDSIVCDPPYELGFMGKAWDRSGVAFQPATWAAALRVAKPGAHLVAFGGTRTFHRMMVAIEDAGWEIRDTLMWVYGSGFPKSHNGEWGGTALKPAWEPIVLARKPLKGTVAKNFAEHGTGGLNVDGCRVGLDGGTSRSGQAEYPKNPDGTEDRSGSWARTGHGIVELNAGRWPANLAHDGSEEVLAAFPDAPGQQGDLTGDEPSRPFKNAYGVMDGRRMAQARIDTGSAARFFYCAKASREDRNEGLNDPGPQFKMGARPCDYQAVNAAGKGNHHPTVKPTDLMRWLCRLVTPPGGHVLDPFTGSGSTGRGATLEGFQFTGVELSEDYARIAEARIRAAQPGLAL